MFIINITISSIVVGLKTSYFPIFSSNSLAKLLLHSLFIIGPVVIGQFIIGQFVIRQFVIGQLNEPIKVEV